MKKALFLDRDGVINEDIGYLHRPEEFRFKDGIFELCRAAKERGYLLIVATNQSGIARGYYSEEEYQKLTNWMRERFLEKGVLIDEIYHCPFYPDEKLGVYGVDSPDRKPNPGMFLKAREQYDLDMGRCVAVGDRETDVEAAHKAGIGCNFLLSETPGEVNHRDLSHEDVQVIHGLREAIDHL